MRAKKQWLLTATLMCGALFMTSCTKDGDVIYQTDPADQASTAPLVSVIYDPNALGDRGYNDLIYQGVENAARKNGHIKPVSYHYGAGFFFVSPSFLSKGFLDVAKLRYCYP